MTDSYIGFESWYSDSRSRVLAVLTVVSGDADVESEARDEAFARADQYMIDTDEWTTFNDSIRAWPVTV